MNGKLLAVSDLHVAYQENQAVLESLYPTSDADWLIVAGDVAERFWDIERALGLLSDRFAKVIWAPGNHELWTHPSDQVTLRGDRRYQRLVKACRDLGVVTPEDPYPVWHDEQGPVTIAPLFVLYDYSFRTPGAATKEESLRIAHDAGVVCTDEYLLHPDPYPTRDAWCRARVEWTERRLQEIPASHRTVLVNHYPLVREPTRILRYPEFAQWCGTELTADWHRRFRATAVVYGHLHIPRVTWHDGVRFEEVSLGYPREWGPRPPREPLRTVPTAPAAAPTLVQELLPRAATATSEAFTDIEGPPETHLFPAELEIIDNAVPARRGEFTTGRVCARRALRELGLPAAPLLRNRRGAPQWPEGVTGSMTHCAGYRAAAVARRGDILGLGIDAEPNEALPDGVLEAIALPREQEWLTTLSRSAPQVHWGRLLFSAKESVFKVWYPLTGRELGFEEALIEVDPEKGTFTARVLVPAPTVEGRALDHFSGRWLCREGLLLTAVALLPAPVDPDRHPPESTADAPHTA